MPKLHKIIIYTIKLEFKFKESIETKEFQRFLIFNSFDSFVQKQFLPNNNYNAFRKFGTALPVRRENGCF